MRARGSAAQEPKVACDATLVHDPGVTLSRERVLELVQLQTGDEKHDWSSLSTLDPLLVLYGEVLRIDPSRPDWEERDRFILSKGHGPTAYYAVLAACGFFPEAWLRGFMQFGNPLGAHPDRFLVPGVEASTGSLGHGLAVAVGVAKALVAKRLSEQRVFCLTGDAELHEGSNWEAILLAPHLRLANLTLIVVDNHSSVIAMSPWEAKFRSFGWHATVVDGRNHTALRAALTAPGDHRPNVVIADVGAERATQ
jgi:transketolase